MNEEYEELIDMPLTELCDYVFQLRDTIKGLRANLRDATDLLNDCGFELVGGVWSCLLYTSPSPRDG